jgi:hypothetical protein
MSERRVVVLARGGGVAARREGERVFCTQTSVEA